MRKISLSFFCSLLLLGCYDKPADSTKEETEISLLKIEPMPFSDQCRHIIKNRFDHQHSEEEIKELKTCLNTYYHNLKHYNSYTCSPGHPLKSSLMTTAKSYYVMEHNGLLQAEIAGIHIPVGGIQFKLPQDPTNYITMEAPHGADIFASLAWRYNISTYITLTTEKDNDPQKLSVYRGTSNNRVDLHHLEKMADKEFSYEYKINNLDRISVQKDFPEIIEGTLYHFSQKRKIRQIKYSEWFDDETISSQTLHNIVKSAQDYYSGGTLAVNCFAGLHRTKTIILAIYAYNLHKLGQKVDATIILKRYKDAVYPEFIKQNGEQAPAWLDETKGQYKLLNDYVAMLNSNDSL